ncbi:MAG: ADP-ribosylglycohydrolase family protein [Deltaproteobacteria bacterium]|nr:ADP-ribosylglycohydrolase family protein [Deltaproteobacteria bacterium]
MSFVEVPFTGRLGMTFAPGKHQTSKSGGRHARDLAVDLDRLVAVYGVDELVCLLEDRELSALKIDALVSEAALRGMTVHRLPIPDAGVLPSLEPARALVRTIIDALNRGRTVVVHCAGGLGRTGTIVGCLLTECGPSVEQGLSALRAARGPNCPETQGQKDFIARYSETKSESVAAVAPSVPAKARSSKEDAFSKVVLAAAIGDAMGHPTEFMSMADIQRQHGESGVTRFELFWERGTQRFAPYTDDTQMAEIVLRTLVLATRRNLDLDSTMRLLAGAFVVWRREPQGGHRAPGNACLSGAENLASGARWNEAGGVTAGGCGSVMRAYPFGLMFSHDLDRAETWAVEHSKLTHRDPIALAACAAMAVGVAQAVNGRPSLAICSAMIAAADRYSRQTSTMMGDAFSDAVNRVPPSVTLDRLRGFAAHEAVAATLYIFARHEDDPRAAILEGANTPGDSDSLATLAGALVAARPNAAPLPAEWVRDVERSEALGALGMRAARSV